MLNINQSEKFSCSESISLPSIEKLFSLYELKKGDNVLIWTDNGKGIALAIAKTFYEKLFSLGCQVSVIVEGPKLGVSKASEITKKAILSLDKGDCFISVGSGNRGYIVVDGKQVLMRDLIRKNGFKMIALGGLSSIKADKVNAFIDSFGADEKEMVLIQSKLKPLLEKTKEVKITCPFGTDFSFSLGAREVICNDGNWKVYSTNYPVGEIYTAPIEDSANGVAFVSSAKISGQTILPKEPIKFVFKNGILFETNNETINDNLDYIDSVNKRENVPDYKKALRTIAEFGIGTNNKAIIVGAMICDEKAFGTCHFAYGQNKHFGGKTECHGHFDNVIANPSIWFDGKQIMDNGKLII